MERLALKLIGLLPETGKWPKRKEAWRTNLESLYTESQHVLKDRACCGRVLALNAGKLLCLYTAAWLSIRLRRYGRPGPANRRRWTHSVRKMLTAKGKK